MDSNPRPRGFTLTELLALLVTLAFLACLFLPELGGATTRRTARQMQNSTQFRGIHQGMVMYAQGNGGYFPGLTRDGSDAGTAVEDRLLVMLRNNYFTGEYAISPIETKTAWTTGNLTTAGYSYAMLQIPARGGRRAEWAETLNTDAAVMSDRNTQPPGGAAQSVWSGSARPDAGWSCSNRRYPQHWLGTVLWNDNHVGFESTHVLRTTYGPALAAHQSDAWFDDSAATPSVNASDDLFTAASDGDALMVYSGN